MSENAQLNRWKIDTKAKCYADNIQIYETQL